MLGFEPADIKRLSRSSFDAYLVNDSNYYLYVTVAVRADHEERWTLRFAGLIEPAIQEFLFEIQPEDLTDLEHISLQAVPFKKANAYVQKDPVTFERQIDPSQFSRLHCFDNNPYFEAKVLAIDVVKNDVVQGGPKSYAPQPHLEKELSQKQSADSRPARPRISKPAQKPQVIEVDLHASALFDNLSGLSKADILNYQVDKFRQVMDDNLRRPGTRIIFIHGKGEGILRQALMKELNHRYKGHDVADASFREYGFGATQVTIRGTKS